MSSAAEGGLDTVIVTGLSGAGRSTAAKCFEDLGYYVVDNLPAELIATLMDLGSRTRGAVTKLAVVMDVRSRAFSTDLVGVIRELDENGLRPRVLFLEASDEVLVRRFENVRRAHPLQGDGRLVDGIAAERDLLGPLRDDADLVVDTSTRSVHDLRRTIENAFSAGGPLTSPNLRATVVSFGFKYGLPVDADLVVDVRFLPNPYWIPELRELTGNDQEVKDYVLSPGRRPALPRPVRRAAAADRCRLPAREQALPHPRGGVHRRQAPLGRDGPGTGPQARGGRGARDRCAPGPRP